MDFDDDDDDDGFFDNELEPFDPAKSAIFDDDSEDMFHSACVLRFIELYQQQFPLQNLDFKQLKTNYYQNSNIFADRYLEKIIRHYYHSKLPFEDDLEPIDKNSFPSNKEIKRFLKENSFFFDFIELDHYTNPQPIDCEKELQLAQLQQYFKILKTLALEFYPQLENLPARGFRELERTLYTITYLLWIELHEFKDRLLGLNKDYFDEMDRKKKEINEKVLENNKKSNESAVKPEKSERLTDEEIDEHIEKWEKTGRLEKLEQSMCNRLYEEMTDKYLEIYPQYNLPRLDFLAKVRTECSNNYHYCFRRINKWLDHYRIYDEPYTEDRIIHKIRPEYKHYKELKKQNKNKEEIDNYLNSLQVWERDDIQMELEVEEMSKTMLKVIYETFPEIINLPASAMVEINARIQSITYFNLKEMNGARNLVLKVHTENHEKFENQMEEKQREHYFEGK